MLTAQIAQLLAALGEKVVVVDFDFDAPGIPAVFGIEPEEIKRGIFELARKFSRESTFEKEWQFKKVLANYIETEGYLTEIESINFNNELRQGELKILPCGRINNTYWKELHSREWMEFLIEPPDKRRSLTRFIRSFLKPALEEMGFTYLLIDSRAGMTQYGRIAQYIADRQVVIFCPNDEARYALKSILIPGLTELLRNPKSEIEKLVFIVSRIPPELSKKKAEVFKEMDLLIYNEFPQDLADRIDVLALHSDLDTQLDSNKRILGKKNENYDTVLIDQDILTIFAKLCDEIVTNLAYPAKKKLDESKIPQKLKEIIISELGALNIIKEIISSKLDMYKKTKEIIAPELNVYKKIKEIISSEPGELEKFKEILLSELEESEKLKEILLSESEEFKRLKEIVSSDELEKFEESVKLSDYKEIKNSDFIILEALAASQELRKLKETSTIIAKIEGLVTSEEYKEYKILSELHGIEDSQRQIALVWYAIFKKKFEVMYKYRLYIFDVIRGAMQNPDDEERNIAFKVETFRNILNAFYETLEKNSTQQNLELRKKECEILMNEALRNAGVECGDAFGTSLVNLLKSKYSEYGSYKEKLKYWCEFDSDAGFGLLEYDSSTDTVVVKNLFLEDARTAKGRPYNAFFEGYADGVMAKLKDSKNEYPIRIKANS